MARSIPRPRLIWGPKGATPGSAVLGLAAESTVVTADRVCHCRTLEVSPSTQHGLRERQHAPTRTHECSGVGRVVTCRGSESDRRLHVFQGYLFPFLDSALAPSLLMSLDFWGLWKGVRRPGFSTTILA